MNWFYASDETSVGPLTEEDFQAKVAEGTITADTLVWHEGMAEWDTYANTSAQQAGIQSDADAAPEPSSEVQCCECGKVLPVDDMINYENSYVCGDCKAVFFQRLQEGTSLPGVVEYGGFWTRVGAKFIDGFIVGAVSMVFSFAASFLSAAAISSNDTGAAFAVQMVLWAIQMLIGLAYTVFFLGRYAATPGKMVCKLKVIRSDGAPITYGRAAGRHFADMLSGLIMYIGYLMAAFDDEKRTLHDRICDTRVIRTQ